MNRQEAESEIYDQQQFQFKKVGSDIKKYFTDKNPKIRWEFEEIGQDMEVWFGKNIWYIFYKPEAELSKVKYAFNQCKKYNKKNIAYLIKIIQNNTLT